MNNVNLASKIIKHHSKYFFDLGKVLSSLDCNTNLSTVLGIAIMVHCKRNIPV